jgi:hypothetical protein
MNQDDRNPLDRKEDFKQLDLFNFVKLLKIMKKRKEFCHKLLVKNVRRLIICTIRMRILHQ